MMSRPSVLMVGTGEYTTGYVHDGASGSDKSAGVVALSYLGFAGFVVLALRRGSPVSSCGCFGSGDKMDSPPTVSHVVLNLAAAATAAWAALHAHPGAIAVLRQQPLAGIALVLLIGAGAYLVMGVLPKILAAGSGP